MTADAAAAAAAVGSVHETAQPALLYAPLSASEACGQAPPAQQHHHQHQQKHHTHALEKTHREGT